MPKKRSNTEGWVYVISDPTRPGLLKIGCTDRTPEKRAAELSGTHAPLPLVVEYQIQVEAAFEAERGVHQLLDASNKRIGKEWFACSVDFAIDAIDTICGPEAVERKRRAQEATRLAAEREERERMVLQAKQRVELQRIEAEREREEAKRVASLRAYHALPWYRRLAVDTWSALTSDSVATFFLWLAVVAGGVVFLWLLAKVNTFGAVVLGLLALAHIPRDVLNQVFASILIVFVLFMVVLFAWQQIS